MRVASLLVALLVGLVGCRGGDARNSPAIRAPEAAVVTEDARAGSTTAAGSARDPWASDPWAVPPDTDAPPNLLARKQLANEACPRVTRPYFYRIEKAGKVSHILGTRHIGVPLSKFPPAVHAAIESAKLAVFEVAPGDDAPSLQRELFLPDELGPELWQRYATLVGKDLASSLERAAPSTALLMMSALYEDLTAMLDLEIQRVAIAKDIPTQGLETAAFQDALLGKLMDLRMLRASIRGIESRDELARDSRRDLAEYCAGSDDTPGMDDEMRADLRVSGYTDQEIAAIDEQLVHARNADWIPKLEPILRRGGAFIAVGADHLYGPRGVIALLEKRGYKITRTQ